MAHSHDTLEAHAAHIRELVSRALRTLPTETVSLAEAVGRVTTATVRSPVDLPLFRNSQMDGYAVRAADLAAEGPTSLPVVGVIPARPGAAAMLPAGTSLRIMTGAVVPDGADAIIPVEDTTPDGERVTIHRRRETGAFVRERGSDVSAGAALVPAGTRLAARHLAALAAAGIGTVAVRARVRVAVITTGAELVAPGTTAMPGQVYDANQSALVAAVTECDAVVSFAARVIDDRSEFAAALTDAAARADLVVTSGGISKGDFEVVRDVLEPLGAHVGHIAMQPGGPQATAEFAGVPIVGFPGNPVSTQVSFAVFLRPLLRAAAGLPEIAPMPARASAGISSVLGKRQFLRGLLDGDTVEIVGGASSHLVASMAAANVLVDIPADTTSVHAGDIVSVWPL